ncbi:hypothetical protein RTBOTA2_006813 [Rhodotorula toruloides]|uniref:Uncharacterized protein n=1 Tax=Rhodotorula toruloides TaxID=5286 RepID=A0A0K3CC67_RHOTO|nr:hypothetical protein RTBOTA2_006813 [Rhodotorula toruloides]PRQ75595.1 hypothetical protein AAT19DRAFT_13652 [Rhodotorula toruloides]
MSDWRNEAWLNPVQRALRSVQRSMDDADPLDDTEEHLIRIWGRVLLEVFEGWGRGALESRVGTIAGEVASYARAAPPPDPSGRLRTPDIFAGHGPHSLLVQTLEKSDSIVGILADTISHTSQNSPLNLQRDWSGHYHAGTRWMQEVGQFFRIQQGEALSCRWRDATLDERHAVIEVLWTALVRLVKREMGPLSLPVLSQTPAFTALQKYPDQIPERMQPSRDAKDRRSSYTHSLAHSLLDQPLSTRKARIYRLGV